MYCAPDMSMMCDVIANMFTFVEYWYIMENIISTSGDSMKKYKHIHILASLKALFFNIFGNKYIMVILDSIATLLITIHTSDIHLDSKEWIIKLIII